MPPIFRRGKRFLKRLDLRLPKAERQRAISRMKVEEYIERERIVGRLEEIFLQLFNPDSYARARAANWLSKFGNKKSLIPLIEALRDPISNVRYQAVRALENLNDRRAVRPLIKALKDRDMDVRARATEALASLKDKRAVMPLCRSLKKDELSVRGDAARALGKLGDMRAIKPLTKALLDKPHVMRNAALALEEIAIANSSPALKEKLIFTKVFLEDLPEEKRALIVASFFLGKLPKEEISDTPERKRRLEELKIRAESVTVQQMIRAFTAK